MNAATNVLRNSESRGKSVDCAGGMGKNGKFGHSEVVTNDCNIICY